MTNGTKVTKRNGKNEPLDLNKLHVMVEEACKDLAGVSASQVEIQSGIQFYDGITTDEIQEILIRSASDLVSLDNPNYQFVAARLLLFAVRKQLYGRMHETPTVKEQVEQCVAKEVYDAEILDLYSDEEFDKLQSFIDHDRDYLFTYAGLRQVCDKYLVQDRSNGKVYETPQFMYLLIAATIFSKYPKETRLEYVRKYYDAISRHKINIPTPIMAGVRTPLRQFASCVLVDVDDTLDSIFSSDMAIGKYVAQRAGIGINAGRIRGINSKIRGGEVQHTGVVPFLKKFESTVRCCTQNGIRGGSATVHFPIWHIEIEDILVLKNNKGTEDNRVRKLDYSIQISKLFYERFIKNEQISLFSPNDVPGLYDAFGTDAFDSCYVDYESDQSVPRKTIGAQELFFDLLKERAETGRIYIMNIDHCNSHSSFMDKVEMSNLCVAPETQILTKDGYQTIYEMVGDYVDVWNGEKWSNVLIEKTSDCQELMKVIIDSEEIECTPYHRFFVVNGKNYSRNKKIIEKRAYDLKSGDKIIKFDLPIIEGELNLENSYTLGFHSGDGSYHRGTPILDLYGSKKDILEYLPYTKYYNLDNKIRVILDIPPHTKFVVPDCNYTIESRLKWFAGLVDSDGHIAKNNQTETVQINSINFEFLRSIKYMLHTLGVDCKIKKTYENRKQFMPDGKGETKEYECNEVWRLLISNSGLIKLCNLGFAEYVMRSKISKNIPNRNAERFHIVEDIIFTGRKDSTYCFTESDRGMGMFNGFLLGNCQEITLPTKPLQHIDDENGEIALCILSAINIGKIRDLEDLDVLCDLAVRSLDELIDFQGYPVRAAEIATRARRSLGIGYIGLAHYLAKNGHRYEDPEAWKSVHDLTEAFQYYLIQATVNLAKEKGACEYSHRTKYGNGILPIDTYKNDVDEIVPNELHYDWESLRAQVNQYGVRNSTLSAQMPSESSSVVSNATNGIEPPRGYLSIKKSKKGPLKQIVPQYGTLKNNYDLLWEMRSNKGYINIVAVMQKFFDQAISGNWSYNPEHYPNNEIPVSVMAHDMLYSYSMGWKTSYYQNTYDIKTDEMDDSNESLDSLISQLETAEEEDCESCKI